MLSFKEYLKEEFLIESNEDNDHKGKMYELLLGKHLSHDKEEKKKLPEHFRSESKDAHGGTPQEVHDRLHKLLGHKKYKEIDAHARSMSEKIKAEAKKNGHKIHEVHWTSNRDTDKKAGDQERLTGKKDVNSNADLIITTRHKDGTTKHIGISAKYGKHKPNYRNAGLDSLEKSAKTKTGTYTNLQKEHEDRLKKIGYNGTQKENHALYKQHLAKLKAEQDAHKKAGKSIDTFKPKSKEAKMAHLASESHLEARRTMAREHEKGLSKLVKNKDDSALREHIRSQVSPKTNIQHYVAHSQTNDKGEVEHHLTDAHSLADEHLKNYHSLHVRKGNGISSDIMGTNKKTGKKEVVAAQGFKASSGAMKGSNGFFKLGSGGAKDD
jgi:hypothetical protein